MRGRLWRIDYIDREVFAATALDGRDNQTQRFHRDLETVESGEMPLPSPMAVGDERQQALLLDGQRFSLLHGTAPIMGLQRSRAIPTDYQLVPLLMALGAEQVRLLIADDVGTGKTIEAGLVLSELLARGKARRVLIVVPANLREQWRDALDHFFHINSTIIAGHLLAALERQLLPGQSVWAAHDVVIASVDYMKMRMEEVLSYPWDLIVIDEAHLCAKPHTSNDRSPEMERWQFATRATECARHLLLLTATPHNGYSDSYASLFEMLDPTLVRHTGGGPTIDRRRARANHVVQRRREDIGTWYAERGVPSPFPRRFADEQIIDLKKFKEMRALLEDLTGYAQALYGSATVPIDRWIAAHLQKRLLSSPYALRRSIDNRLRAVKKRTETTAPGPESAREATGDLLFTEADEGDAANLDLAVASLDRDTELASLQRIADLARRVTPVKDPKLVTLLGLIPERMKAHPNMQRVMVFTKYKDTLDYLVDNTQKAVDGKIKNYVLPDRTHVFAIHGQMNLAARRSTFAQFEQSQRAVLIATDCISEGLNLQRACAELVHYELPWNPNRLEQRNGRIDRFQQREPFVGIRTLVLDDPLDAALLYLIVTKSQQMRNDYGFVPPFLANTDILLHLSDPEAAYRAKLLAGKQGKWTTPSLFEDAAESGDLSELDETLAQLAETNLADGERVDRVRDESFYGQADVSLATIEAALTRSRTEIGSAERIRAFTIISIRELGATLMENADGTFSVPRPPDVLADCISRDIRYSFDPNAGIDDPDVDVVDLAHPLLRRLIDLSLDAGQAPACTGRVTGRISAAAQGTTAVLHVLFRYVTHGNPPVLLEELVPVAYRLLDGSEVENVTDLLLGDAGHGTKDRSDIEEDAREVLTDPTLRPRLGAVGAGRAVALAQQHADLNQAWASGLDQVEPMSYDVVALTLVYPEVRA